jgi:hypothetical protein
MSKPFTDSRSIEIALIAGTDLETYEQIHPLIEQARTTALDSCTAFQAYVWRRHRGIMADGTTHPPDTLRSLARTLNITYSPVLNAYRNADRAVATNLAILGLTGWCNEILRNRPAEHVELTRSNEPQADTRPNRTWTSTPAGPRRRRMFDAEHGLPPNNASPEELEAYHQRMLNRRKP